MSVCSQCSATFGCGNESGADACWCASLPRILPLDFDEPCLCPRCLKRRIRERIEAFVATVTPQNAAAAAARARRYAGDEDPIEGLDYEEQGGLLVFTAWYLLKRGTCCESGCRHCPYGFRRRA